MNAHPRNVDPEITLQLQLARWWSGLLGGVVLVIGCIWLALSGVRLLHAPGFDALSSTLISMLLLLSWAFMQRRRAAIRRTLANVTRDSILQAVASHSRFWAIQSWILVVALVLALASGVWSTVNPAIAEAWKAVHAERTVKRMQAIGEALEAYAIDHASYPEAADIDELIPIIQPLSETKLEGRDGWGNPLVYRTLCEDGLCYSHRLISGGSDGVADHSEKPWQVEVWRLRAIPDSSGDFTKDFMYGDGRFILLPSGVNDDGKPR